MDNTVREALRNRRKEVLANHKESQQDAVYMEGYNALLGKNPYPFPTQLDLARNRISISPGQLTSEETKQLQALNKEFELSEWQRWARGNDFRWSVGPELA